ncbi:MAG: hypothetical protein RB296_12600 [Acidobacteriota bacterium]|jgi:hypothetical protein|nr:hypothetical protein [Acidobacteriota bacterium]
MKRILILSMLFVALLAFQACGGKSNDPKAVMGDYLTATEGYINDMEKSASAADVAKATNAFADRMEALTPRMKAMMEAHPELKGMKGNELPAGFEQFKDRFESMGPRMMGIMGKLMQYGEDQAVKDANERLQKVTSSLDD